MNRRLLPLIAAMLTLTSAVAWTAETVTTRAARTSENTNKLGKVLAQFPEADLDGDGVLTQEEWDQARESTEKQSKQRLGKNAETKLRKPDFADVAYGPDPLNVLDFWQAQAESPTPVVIWFHGGGFENGSKGTIGNRTLVPQLLEAGVSFVSADYRLRGTTAIQDILRDGARVVQFMRHQAAEWNIDPERIVCMGGSAGAGMSVWIGVHDDLADPQSDDPVARESSRIAGVVGLAPQCSYDMEVWLTHVPDSKPAETLSQIHQFYKFSSPEDLKSEEGKRILNDVNMMGMLSSDDPPMLLFSNAPDVPAGSPGFSGNHHPLHVLALKKQADAVGVACETWFSQREPMVPKGESTDVVVYPFLSRILAIPAAPSTVISATAE